MKHSFARAALAMLLTAVSLSVIARQPEPAVSSNPRLDVMRPVSLTLPGMDKVQRIADLRYARNDPLQLMDVYLPAGTGGRDRLPVVVFIHGGTEIKNTPKDWGVYTSWGRLVAASGMAAVTFNYTAGYPQTRLVESRRDVKAALAFMSAESERLHIDPTRIVLVAFSAGGPLLSLPFQENLPGIRALAGFYPILDIRHSPIYQAGEATPMLNAMSVVAHIETHPERAPPMFIARAGQDAIPGLNQTVSRFVDTALARNLDVTVVNHAAGEHGFDFLSTDARSREIVAMALAFFEAHLR